MDKSIDFGLVADLYDYYTNVDFDIDFYKMLCTGHHKILELMCGTGRVSAPLIREGFSVSCVDYSEEMLAIFQRKINEYPDVKLHCQDVSELDLDEQFDLILIPFNSFSEIIDSRKRQSALNRIYAHLSPGGTFFCTLYNPKYQIDMADGILRYLGKYDIGGQQELVITNFNLFSSATGIISGIQFYEIYQNSKLIEKRFLELKFAVITREELCEMAQKEGFLLKAVYGDYTPYHFDQDSEYMNFLFQKRDQSKYSRKTRKESRKY